MADSLALAHEAVTFSRSQFGKHYIARLERIRDDYRSRAEDINATESQSRALSLKASAYEDEIGYFRTATEIVSNPGIVKRLTNKLRAKEDTSV